MIDAFASLPHYAAHLLPVWEALPAEQRGTFWSGDRGRPWGTVLDRTRDPARLTMVASWRDAQSVAPSPLVYLEHGAGQSYDSDPAAVGNGSYSGGAGLGAVRLFVCPNQVVAARWQAVYPDAAVAVVGCPKLDRWLAARPHQDDHDDGNQHDQQQQLDAHGRDGTPPTVAVTFHWELLPEGTTVAGPRPVGAHVRRYDGPLVEIECPGPHRLAASPNHPVLTRRGWVRAGDLVVGDDLVRCRIGQRGLSVAPHAYLPPSRIEHVAGAFLESLSVVTAAVPAAAPHFDHQRAVEQVHVVGADGFLRDGVDEATLSQHGGQSAFEGAHLAGVRFAGGRSVSQLVHGRTLAGPRGVVRPPLEGYPSAPELAVDGGQTDAEGRSQFLAALPGEVSLHKIVQLRIRQFAGHGYDLTTVPRWYLANGFVVHNCALVPETRSAWRHYDYKLPALVTDPRWRVLGHGHPRLWGTIRRRWQQLGVEHTADADEVLARADLLVMDNTSLGYEAAAVGIPVLVLNSPDYRRHVHHGLRFWSHPPGLQIDRPDELLAGVAHALTDPPAAKALRHAAVAAAYSAVDGRAAERAATAILEVHDARPIRSEGMAPHSHR